MPVVRAAIQNALSTRDMHVCRIPRKPLHGMSATLHATVMSLQLPGTGNVQGTCLKTPLIFNGDSPLIASTRRGNP